MEVWDSQMHISLYRMNKQQGPNVQHGELYSTSYDKHNGKEYEKERVCVCVCVCVYACITESLCYTAVTNITL